MTALQIRIMIRACKIRVSGGEALEDVLGSYSALSEEDKSRIRQGMR